MALDYVAPARKGHVEELDAEAVHSGRDVRDIVGLVEVVGSGAVVCQTYLLQGQSLVEGPKLVEETDGELDSGQRVLLILA